MSALTDIAQEDTWATNANAFVAQEEDETETYGVRVAGFGLLNVRDHLFIRSAEAIICIQTILGRSPSEVCVAFQDILQQIIGSCQATREAGVPSWQVYFISGRIIDSFVVRTGGNL